MGCCFTRLRFKGKQKSSPVSSKSGDHLVFKSHIVTLFPNEGNTGKELQREAIFLKACGAILRTPSEFSCPSKNTKLQTQSQDVLPKTNLSALDPPCKPIQWDNLASQVAEDQPNINSQRAIQWDNLTFQVTEDQPNINLQRPIQWENLTVQSAEDQPNISLPLSTAAPAKTKSVRFEEFEEKMKILEPDHVSASIQTPRKIINEKYSNENSSKNSPAPTPLKLTEKVETPGTVYPTKLENQRLGLNPQIRSQLIYPVEKSVCPEEENMVQVLNSDHSPNSSFQINVCSSDEIENAEVSRSIELWEGNGIPNSTRKYREDQKVRYHSTPFEERIRKALSDEKVHPQRKLLI